MNLEQLKTDYLDELAVFGFATGTIAYRQTYLSQFVFFLQLQGVGAAGDLSRELVYDY